MALGEGAGVEEGDTATENFTKPKHNGLFANYGLGLPSSSNLRLWWITPTDWFVELQAKRAN